MKEQSFAMVAGVGGNGRIACTQVPVMVEERDEKIILQGHMARKSDHHRAFETNPSALIVFTSPHTYVSGTWYIGNLEQASTWNYISVHARGELRWMEEPELRELLRRTTLHFEKGDKSSTTIYDNLPPAYVDNLVKAIVGFEMEVQELENVFKLSQNRDEQSYHHIIAQLEKQDEAGRYIAGKMKRNSAVLFNKEPGQTRG